MLSSKWITLLFLVVVSLSVNATNLYWHGNTPQISLPSNWTLDQAGTQRNSAPITASDNLFFNGTGANSDANCTIDSGFTANTVDFTGYTGRSFWPRKEVIINGDLILDGSMTNDGLSSQLIMKGSSPQKLKFKSGFYFENIRLHNKTTVKFEGSVSSNWLSLDSGNCDLGDVPVKHSFSTVAGSAKMIMRACTLSIINGYFKSTKFDRGTGFIEINAIGKPFINLQGSYNGDTLPPIIKKGPARLSFAELNSVFGFKCTGFTILEGNLDISFLNVYGNFTSKGADTLRFLKQCVLNVDGNTTIEGTPTLQTKLYSDSAKYTIASKGALTAKYAKISKSIASISKGMADPLTCVDGGNNVNWDFGVKVIPSNVAFKVNPVSYTTNVKIDTNTITYSGSMADSFTITPALPAGLILERTKGFIYGTPTAVSAASNYTITVHNSVGSASAILSITVNNPLTRPVFSRYLVNPATYVVGTLITPNTPTLTGGTPTSFSISPSLPNGLVFSNQTGLITGTPTAPQAVVKYTVKASNAAGTDSIILNITINEAITKPASITYSTPNASYVVGTQITPNNPTVTGGTPTNFSINPALPNGLSFNTQSGTINGTPLAAQTLTRYTIEASNSAGSASTTIEITITNAVQPPRGVSYLENPVSYFVNELINPNTITVGGGAPTSFSINPNLTNGLSFNTQNGTITGTPTTEQSSTKYVIKATNSAGSDSVALYISVIKRGNIVNPLSVSGSYKDATHINLRINGVMQLTPGPTLPFVKYVGVWYKEGSLPTVPDTTGSTVPFIRFSVAALQKTGSSFYDTVITVPAVSTIDSSYFLNAAPVWNISQAPVKDSVAPFDNRNGWKVIMKDTISPENRLTISGTYRTPDTVTFQIGNCSSISATLSDSVFFWYGFGAPDFKNGTAQAFHGPTLSSSAGGVYSFTVKNSIFNILEDSLRMAIYIRNKNGRSSQILEGSVLVGSKRPTNPIILTATTAGASKIYVSWQGITTSNSDSVRIYYSRNPIPLQATLPDSVRRITLGAQISSDTIRGLNPSTQYYFGGQNLKNGIWSLITQTASAQAKTDTSTLSPNTLNASIENAWFDTSVNEIKVAWKLDSLPQQTVYAALTFNLGYSTPLPPASGLPIKSIKDTIIIKLGTSMIFDTVFTVALWFKTEPTYWNESQTKYIRTVRTPKDPTWQTVAYFSGQDSIISFLKNTLFFRKPSNWVNNTFLNDVEYYVPGNFDGMMNAGNGLNFRTKDRPSPPFWVGFRPVVQSPFTIKDVLVYKNVNGTLVVVDSVSYDTTMNVVWFFTNDFKSPLFPMIDTTPPIINIEGDISTPVLSFENFSYNINFTENIQNATVQFYCSRGDMPLTSITKYKLNSKTFSDSFVVQKEFVSEDNGVRAMIQISDGRHVVKKNISRSVIRKTSDPLTTVKATWYPLHVTANIDKADLVSCLDEISASAPWTYDKTNARVFKWNSKAGDMDTKFSWEEYSPDKKDLFSFKPGDLFWIKTKDAVNLNFGSGVTTSLRDTVSITLPPRSWSDFALPWLFSMCVGDIIESTKSSEFLKVYKWDNSKDGKFQTQLLFSKDATGFDLLSTIMSSFSLDCYAILNPTNDPIILKIPPIPSNMSTYNTVLTKRRNQESWTIQLDVNSEVGNSFGTVYCGYNPSVKQKMTSPKTPSFTTATIGISESNSSADYSLMVVPQLVKNGYEWKISLSSLDTKNQQLVGNIKSFNFPNKFAVAILDKSKGTLQMITDNSNSFTIDPVSKSQGELVVVTGDNDYMLNYSKSLQFQHETLFRNIVISSFGSKYIQGIAGFTGIANLKVVITDLKGQTVWRTHVRNIQPGAFRLPLLNNGVKYGSGRYFVSIDATEHSGKRLNLKKFVTFIQ